MATKGQGNKQSDRFDGLLGGINKPNNAEGTVKSQNKSQGESGNFWSQFEDAEKPEATQRLNIEVPLALHRQFKHRCNIAGVSQKDAIIQLIRKSLDE